ncbi:hypothetical protein J4463_03810 [Candidatus Pacearchaeota archaeon]|nr:hypothetical protein [Candidatus Pacearchaeota archaeon]
MNFPLDFNYYLRKGIVKKGTFNAPRAQFLKVETEKSFIGLKNRIEKLGIDEFNANSIIKDVHDIILEKIRAKMMLDGYSASGNFAHEAEVAYMKLLGFSEQEVSFANELRQSRNSISYYGKLFEEDYAKKCFEFLTTINLKLSRLFEK